MPYIDTTCPQALFSLFLVLAGKVAGLSEERPLCLVVDDVDAVDPLTAWLGFLVRRTVDRPIALLVARGTEPARGRVAEALAGLEALPCGSVVDLRALHRLEVADVVRAALRTAPDPGLVDLCHQLSGSTPRHLKMLPALLRPSAAGRCPLLADLNRAAVTAVVSAA